MLINRQIPDSVGYRCQIEDWLLPGIDEVARIQTRLLPSPNCSNPIQISVP